MTTVPHPLVQIVTTLRDRPVYLGEIKIAPADPSVGIMSEYPEGYTIHCVGCNLPISYDALSREEQELLDNAVMEAFIRHAR